MEGGISVNRGEQLIRESRIRDVFTPRTPILRERLLVGRQAELKRIIAGLSEPGGHAVIFGDRGVGKTSLAIVVKSFFEESLGEGNVHYFGCSPTSTLNETLRDPLARVGVRLSVFQVTTAIEEGGDASINAGIAKGGVSSKRTITHAEKTSSDLMSPTWVAEHLRNHAGLLIVDELDNVSDPGLASDLSVLIKQLSDSRSPFKICIIGIADTVEMLLRGHPSSGRAVVEARLNRLAKDELREIVVEGAKRCFLSFDEQVIEEIVLASAGYPYFAHLLALKCAEQAVLGARKRVTQEDLLLAWNEAATDSEASLRVTFMRGINYDPGSLAAWVLYAAAAEGQTEVPISRLKSVLRSPCRPTPEGLKDCIEALLADGQVIVRVHQGVLKFVDPRMPSFIVIFRKSQGN